MGVTASHVLLGVQGKLGNSGVLTYHFQVQFDISTHHTSHFPENLQICKSAPLFLFFSFSFFVAFSIKATTATRTRKQLKKTETRAPTAEVGRWMEAEGCSNRKGNKEQLGLGEAVLGRS